MIEGIRESEESVGREAESPALSLLSNRLAIIVLLIASIVPLAAALRLDHRFPADDAMISLTYAKNLARGDGFVFNQPPAVLATTTPAFTMAVALLVAVTAVEPTIVALWISALTWLVLIWAFFLFRRAFALTVGQSAIIGWMVAAQGWVEHLSMEAYPFALILVVAAAMVWSKRWFLGGLAGGVLFLTRGEGVLFVSILGLVVLVGEIKGRGKGRSPTLMYVVGAGLPILIWSAYALPVFGSILPATLAAKMAQVSSGLWAPFSVRLLGDWLPGWGIGPWGGISVLLGYLMVGAGLIVIATSRHRMAIFPAWALAYAVGYSVLGVPGYTWYRLPVIFVLTVTAGLGVEAAFRLGAGDPRGHRIRITVAGTLAAALVLSAMWPIAETLRSPPNDRRGPIYRDAAQWLNDNSEPEQAVAFFEVGTLGYYCDLAIVDLVGLVTPSVIPHILNRDFASGFWEIKPDYLINLEGSEFTRAIVENPLFSSNFSREFVLDDTEGRRLTIYQSREAFTATRD